MASASYNMYRVRRTVHEMLKDRGYMIDQADIDLTEEGFTGKYGDTPLREQMTILVQKRDDPTDQIFVFWPQDPKVGVKPIKRCARLTSSLPTKTCMGDPPHNRRNGGGRGRTVR